MTNSTVNTPLTPNRDNAEFAGFIRRIIRAQGVRVGNADPEALVDLIAARDHLDQAIDAAVAGLRAAGFSWSEIAAPLGVSKQAAAQRWSKANDQGN